jgi:hypothetical protein
MAKIRSFVEEKRDRYTVHDEIDAVYFSFEKDGRYLFQIDTHGRDGRKLEGKTSQTLQIDKAAAIQLIEILKRSFKL